MPATVPTMPQSLDTDGPWSSFEPIGNAADPQGIGRSPSATVDPDQTLAWWRRLLPLLRPTAPRVAVALFASLVAQIIGVEIPQVLKRAIDRGLIAEERAALESTRHPRRARRVARRAHLLLPGIAVPARVRLGGGPAHDDVRPPHAHVVLVL